MLTFSLYILRACAYPRVHVPVVLMLLYISERVNNLKSSIFKRDSQSRDVSVDRNLFTVHTVWTRKKNKQKKYDVNIAFNSEGVSYLPMSFLCFCLFLFISCFVVVCFYSCSCFFLVCLFLFLLLFVCLSYSCFCLWLFLFLFVFYSCFCLFILVIVIVCRFLFLLFVFYSCYCYCLFVFVLVFCFYSCYCVYLSLFLFYPCSCRIISNLVSLSGIFNSLQSKALKIFNFLLSTLYFFHVRGFGVRALPWTLKSFSKDELDLDSLKTLRNFYNGCSSVTPAIHL